MKLILRIHQQEEGIEEHNLLRMVPVALLINQEKQMLLIAHLIVLKLEIKIGLNKD